MKKGTFDEVTRATSYDEPQKLFNHQSTLINTNTDLKQPSLTVDEWPH